MYQRGMIHILYIIIGLVLIAVLIGVFTASSSPSYNESSYLPANNLMA